MSSTWVYLRVPQYFWIGLTSAWERGSGIPGSGAVILAVLVGAALAARSAPPKLRHLAWAGLAGALTQFVFAGLTRISFGVEQATSVRYVYLVAVLMAPALAMVLLVADRLSEPRWVPTCFAVALVALVVVDGIRFTHEFMVARRTLVTSLRERVLGTASLVKQGALVLTTKPNELPAAHVLGSPEVRAALPERSPGAQGLLDSAAYIEVGVSSARLPIPSAQKPALIDGFGSTSAAPSGCHDYPTTSTKPVIDLPPTKTGSQIRITIGALYMAFRRRRGQHGTLVKCLGSIGPPSR